LLLRESGESPANLHAITDGGDPSVPAGVDLSGFVDAVLGGTDDELAKARSTLTDEVGEQGMRDASAVIANFQRMVRIADGLGIALDAPTEMATRADRDRIGVDSFGSASHTPPPKFLQRIGGRVTRPFVKLALRLMSWRAKR